MKVLRLCWRRRALPPTRRRSDNFDKRLSTGLPSLATLRDRVHVLPMQRLVLVKDLVSRFWRTHKIYWSRVL